MLVFIILAVKGFLIGFLGSFTALPYALYCSNCILENSVKKARLAALGVGIAHLFYGLIGTLTIYFSLYFHAIESQTLALLSSLALFIMSLKCYRSPPAFEPPSIQGFPFLKMLKYSLCSLFPLLGSAALLGVLGAEINSPWLPAILSLCAGLVLGIGLWWVGFMKMVDYIHTKLSFKMIRRLHQLEIAILICFTILGILKLYL